MRQSCFTATHRFTGGVALVTLLSTGCGAHLPHVDPFSDPDDRLLFAACRRLADTASVLGPEGASGAAAEGCLGVGSVVDLRPQGDTLFFATYTYEEERPDPIGQVLAVITDTEWVPDTIEVTEIIPVVVRPRMDSVLLADMRRRLEQPRIGTDTVAQERPPLRVDMWLIETQIMRLGETLFTFKAKAEGKVAIRVRVSDTERDARLWERLFTAVDTVRAISVGKRQYRRALSNAYCRALDMITAALDSADVRQAAGGTDGR